MQDQEPIVLPLEIWLKIIQYFDHRNCLNLRRVNRLINSAVVTNWKAQQSLYVFDGFYKDHCRKPFFARTFSDAYVQTCILKNGFDFEFNLFVNFIDVFMPKLVGISFRGCKLLLNAKNLTDLAKRMPNLEYLDLGQKLDQPKLASDCLKTISYFKNLKSLNLDGLLLNSINMKPVKKKNVKLFQEIFPRLERLSFICTSGMLFRTIAILKHLDLRFPKLRRVRIGNRSWVTLSGSDLRLLDWFLTQHCHTLERVHLQDFVFDNQSDMRLIFQSLHCMSHLELVTLDGCSCRHKIPPQLYQIRKDKAKLIFKGWVPETQQHSITAVYMNA